MKWLYCPYKLCTSALQVQIITNKTSIFSVCFVQKGASLNCSEYELNILIKSLRFLQRPSNWNISPWSSSYPYFLLHLLYPFALSTLQGFFFIIVPPHFNHAILKTCFLYLHSDVPHQMELPPEPCLQQHQGVI